MKRLVYNPRVDVFVKSDSGIVDLSPFVTECSVVRRANQVSKATVSFRNPTVWDNQLGRSRMAFTEHYYTDPKTGATSLEPMFHPMDPITITMTRLRDRPIQVFTGFCDTTPYLQLFPGVCTIEASCTLKRLQYTYWDPGLPFVWEFLQQDGWQVSRELGGLVNRVEENRQFGEQKELTDGSIGGLLYNILTEVGGWDPSTIWIENLPPGIVDLVERLFSDVSKGSEQAQSAFISLLKDIIGQSSYGSGFGAGGGTGTTGTATLDDAPEDLKNFPRKAQYTRHEIKELCKAAGFPDPSYAAGVCWCESGGNANNDSYLGGVNKTSYSSSNPCCHGLWQLYLGNSPLNNNIFSNTEKGWNNARDPLISTWYTAKYIRAGGSWNPWECVTKGMVNPY